MSSEDFSTANLTARPVGVDDVFELFTWRNDPLVRNASRNPSPIDLARHRAWLKERLHDPQSTQFLIMAGSTAVGYVRFEDTGGYAEVSIYVNPQLRGRGLGSAVLAAGRLAYRRDRDNVQLRAYVRHGNAASTQMFERAGFQLGPIDESGSWFICDEPRSNS